MRDDHSSPDPLNDDSYISLPKPQNLLRITHNIPSQPSSNKRQTFQLDVGNEISPQKIRVTVEASDNCSNDDSDIACSLYSTPSRQRRIIKQNKLSSKDVYSIEREDTAVTPRKGRERTKNINSAASVRKTPINKNLRSKTVAKGSINFDHEKNCEFYKINSPEKTPKRTKERTQSRSRKPKDTPQNRHLTKLSDKETSQTSDTKTKKIRNSRNNSSQSAALHDTSHSLNVEDNVLDLKGTDQNEINSKSTCQNSRSIRPKFNGELSSSQRRLGSKNNVTQAIENLYTHQGDISCDKNKPSSKYYPSPASPVKLLSQDLNKISGIASETQIDRGSDSDNKYKNGIEFLNESRNEEYRESDTILGSEEFSMISVESLTSMQEYLGSSFFDGTNLRNENALMNNNTRENLSSVEQAMSNNQFHDLDNHLFKSNPHSSKGENNHNSNAYDAEKVDKGGSSWSDKKSLFRELTSGGTQFQKKTSMAESEVFDEHIDLFPRLPASVADADIPAALPDGKYLHAPDNLQRSLPNQKSAPDLFSSRIRLLTPKKTSSPVDCGINDFESPSPIGRAPVMKSSGDLLDLSLTKSCIPSSPTSPKFHCHSKTPQTKQGILHNSFVTILSPSLTSPLCGEKSGSPPDPTPRNSLDEVSSASSKMISPDLIAEPSSKFTRNGYGNYLTRESTKNELKCNVNDKSNLLSHQKQLEVQAQTPDHFYRNSILSMPSVKTHTLDKNQKQFNICSTSENIKRAAGTDHCNRRDDDMMSWQSEEYTNVPKKDSSAKFDESNDKLDEEEEDDFDLLLETINSTSPVALKFACSTERMYEISRSPAISLNYSRSLVDDEITSLESSNIYEQNNQAKKLKKSKSVTPIRANNQNAEEIMPTDNYCSKIQTIQKAKFQPTVQKTPNSDLSAFSKESPVDKTPRMPIISRKLSTQASKISDSPFNHTPKSVSFENLCASEIRRPVTPISQKVELHPRIRIDSFPLERTNLDTSHRSSRVLFPIPSNPKTNINENNPQSNTHISSPSLHGTNSTSLSRAVNIKEKWISHQNHIIKCDQSLDSSIEKINPSKQSLSQKVPSNSPTKSCLRSPLKQRSEYPSIIGSPIRAVTFVSSSPLPPSQTYPSLSSKTWTRNHWLALNDIVQKWKAQQHCTPSSIFFSRDKSPMKKQNTNYSGSIEGNYCHRNSTKVISQLLGKYVFNAKGDRLKLEQWHLEAVDEFRGIAPGWEEKVVAMRLFALLIGEKIRAQRKT